jgi:hypothetical protein
VCEEVTECSPSAQWTGPLPTRWLHSLLHRPARRPRTRGRGSPCRTNHERAGVPGALWRGLSHPVTTLLPARWHTATRSCSSDTRLSPDHMRCPLTDGRSQLATRAQRSPCSRAPVCQSSFVCTPPHHTTPHPTPPHLPSAACPGERVCRQPLVWQPSGRVPAVGRRAAGLPRRCCAAAHRGRGWALRDGFH